MAGFRIGPAIAIGLLAWCVLVLYVIASVSLFGFPHPLGRSAPASLFYGLFFMDPYFPHRGKLDLPIALIHLFLLYKSGRWLWRHGRRRA